MARSSRSSGPGGPGSPRARLFVALDPDPADQAALAEWRDRAIAGRSDLRPVARESLHLTLAFLGYRPEKEVPAIEEAAFGALAGAVPAALDPVGIAPVPRRAPRLFALDLEDRGGAAGAVQSAVERALAERRLHVPERRDWWPHVTIARVKRGARAEPLELAPPPGPLHAGRVTLYRSILRPQGALYVPLARRALAPSPGDR
ncbi:MAG TPA: RNA 2',3'-cyclic phosphodiesterase [Thermoleophilaceae bacterium]